MSLQQRPSWQRQPETNKIVVNDPLAVIYNESQWKVCKMSALYNLSYDAIKLKQYSAKIRQNITSSVTSNLTVKYSVKIDIVANLKYSDEDADALMITVSSSKESNNNNNNKSKDAYKAILLSWGAFSMVDEATHLPYMLEKGEQKLGTIVKATLQTIFDCNIFPFTFSQNKLLQLGFGFLDQDSSKDDEAFRIVLKTPQVDHKDKLKISFQIGDLRTIWDGVKNDESKPTEIIRKTYQILQNQIYHTLKLDISVFELCDVATPKAEVKNEGIVKIKTPEAVNCVFTVLNDFCSEEGLYNMDE